LPRLSEDRVEKPEEAVKTGQVMPFKILKMDREHRKIGLSARAVGNNDPIIDTRNYTSAEGGMASLGELAGLSSMTSSAPASDEDES
jgi:ribosomal protein S1